MGRDNRDDRNKIKRRKVSSSDRKPTAQTSSTSSKPRNKKNVSSKKSSGRFKGVKTVALIGSSSCCCWIWCHICFTKKY